MATASKYLQHGCCICFLRITLTTILHSKPILLFPFKCKLTSSQLKMTHEFGTSAYFLRKSTYILLKEISLFLLKFTNMESSFILHKGHDRIIKQESYDTLKLIIWILLILFGS